MIFLNSSTFFEMTFDFIIILIIFSTKDFLYLSGVLEVCCTLCSFRVSRGASAYVFGCVFRATPHKDMHVGHGRVAFLCRRRLLLCRYHLYITSQSFVAVWLVYNLWPVRPLSEPACCMGKALKSDVFVSPQRQGGRRTTNIIGRKTRIAMATC